jgi:hypothetical protein
MQAHNLPAHAHVHSAPAVQTSDSVIAAKNTQAAKAVYEAALASQSALDSQAAQVHVQTAVNTQFNGRGHASYAHPFLPARPIQQRTTTRKI